LSGGKGRGNKRKVIWPTKEGGGVLALKNQGRRRKWLPISQTPKDEPRG